MKQNKEAYPSPLQILWKRTMYIQSPESHTKKLKLIYNYEELKIIKEDIKTLMTD